MPDLPIKKRLDRAKHKAHRDLEALGFHVFSSNNQPVCLVAIDPASGGCRLIRVCLDEIRRSDREALSPLKGLPVEIWLRRVGSERFERHKV